MGGDPHAQDLVGAQAQHVQDDGVELVQGPVDAVGQDGVVPAAQAQGAVGQGGGEAGVAPVQALVFIRIGRCLSEIKRKAYSNKK